MIVKDESLSITGRTSAKSYVIILQNWKVGKLRFAPTKVEPESFLQSVDFWVKGGITKASPGAGLIVDREHALVMPHIISTPDH